MCDQTATWRNVAEKGTLNRNVTRIGHTRPQANPFDSIIIWWTSTPD